MNRGWKCIKIIIQIFWWEWKIRGLLSRFRKRRGSWCKSNRGNSEDIHRCSVTWCVCLGFFYSLQRDVHCRLPRKWWWIILFRFAIQRWQINHCSWQFQINLGSCSRYQPSSWQSKWYFWILFQRNFYKTQNHTLEWIWSWCSNTIF